MVDKFRWCSLGPGQVAAPILVICAVCVAGINTAHANVPPVESGAQPAQNEGLLITEYRVEGVNILSQSEVESAVYPYLGPGKTPDDVEAARAALEKIYLDKGYQAVSVVIPAQQVRGGVVQLQVVEGTVGRLRVKNSRYFDLETIKEAVPSLAEGEVPNFNEVTEDIIALNQWPDRRVTPALRAGAAPGTVDVDLIVEDAFPLHGSLELNNRNSQNTEPLRLNANVRYDNLWQLGHSINLSYQVAPERPEDAEVYSGSYLARIPGIDWLSLLAYGLKSNSDVASVGGMNVTGRGEVIGVRGIASLPFSEGFFHSVTFGADYKHFDEGVTLGGDSLESPVTYYPFTGAYNATWVGDDSTTQANLGVTFNFRGLGTDESDFDNKRYKARSGFIYLTADTSHTQELPHGMQAFGKLSGQLTGQPLISSEQISAGGLDTVRGYMESEALGDSGLIGRLELRSPQIPVLIGNEFFSSVVDEWRVRAFVDGAALWIEEPLPDQDSNFELLSVGVGTEMKLLNHLNGSVDLGLPLTNQSATEANDPRATFRVWADF